MYIAQILQNTLILGVDIQQQSTSDISSNMFWAALIIILILLLVCLLGVGMKTGKLTLDLEAGWSKIKVVLSLDKTTQ